MIQKKLVQEAIRSIWSQRGRSFLTSLGIIIGAATVILVIDFGEGAKADIAQQFSNLSVTTIFINAPANSDGTLSKLSYKDAVVIKEKAVHISDVAPVLSGKVAVTAGSMSEQINVVGTSVDFAKLSNLAYSAGKFFDQDQEDSKKRVVVLGATAAETLFGENSTTAVGQSIKVNKKTFEVIGITNEKGGSFGPISIDESIFMPFTAAERYALADGGKMTVNASAKDLASIEIAMGEISSILRDEHKLPAGSIDDFKLKDMGSNVVAAKESTKTMALLLSSVAAIVLIVGGIGIMNVMYINVTERTREIGLRKALGAKKKQIMAQFLVEAAVISLVGSLVGVALGLALYPVAGHFGMKIVHAWWGVFVAIGFSLSIGIFFGYHPAKKAAGLNPIEALRYE
ncbi:MAG: ABC transporter permease [Candidatus Saccharibacteria bacterium]